MKSDAWKESENLRLVVDDLQKARLECSRIEQQLCLHLEFEKLISSLATNFINLPANQTDEVINDALKAIGEFSGVERSYIFLLESDLKTVNCSYEWCAAGIKSQMEDWQGLSREGFPWFTHKMESLETVYVLKVSDLPAEARAERDRCLAQSIKSFICVPMVYQGVLGGFIGFASLKTEVEWPEESIILLKIVSEMFMNAIQSKRVAEELHKYRDRLEELVRERTAELEQEIAERKRVEDEINSLRQQIEFILGATKTGLDIIDSDYNILYIDSEWQKVYGDPKGKKCYEYFMDRKEACPGCGIKRALETKQIFVSEEVLVKENNRPIQVTTMPFQAKNGEWLVAEVNVDIGERKHIEEELRRYRDRLEELVQERTIELDLENNERKQAEEALRVSESRYRAIIEDQAHFVCRWLGDGTLTFVNEAFCRYFGKPREELIGTNFITMISPQDRQALKDNFAALTRENPVDTYEYRVVLSNGQIHWQQWATRVIFNDEGGVVEFQSVGHDITERKLAQQALEQSERFLSNIFSSIQDGISILDSDLNILRVNPSIEKWYAHALPLVGKKCYEAYHCKSAPCDICPSKQTLETGKAAYEVVAKTGEGGKIVGWLDLYSFPLVDAVTGKLKGVIEYVRDITERKKAEGEKIALNKELLKSNKRLKKLALRDPHTGLYNHRYLQEIIEAEFYRARRYAQPLSVMMLDIDYFKSINDVYGHKFGDLVLKQFAKILRKMVRRYDVVIRYGGEEFVIISSSTERSHALSLAKRILDAINLFEFGNKKHSVKLKLSIAVVSYNEDKAVKGMDLVELTDEILNQAKESGGNRVYSALDINKTKSPLKLSEKSGSVKFLYERIYKLSKRANQSLMEAIFAFTKTIEVKDHYTGEHVEKTVRYATEVARALNLPEHDIELIRQAAMLHDLGKIGVSEKILLKKGRLTKREYLEIKRHPQIGVDIIRPIQFLHPILPILLYHHERWDGKGYPAGLKAEEIPVGARVVALADVYQALISERCYRAAYPRDKALQIIRHNSGKLFDPAVVDAFLRVVHKV